MRIMTMLIKTVEKLLVRLYLQTVTRWQQRRDQKLFVVFFFDNNDVKSCSVLSDRKSQMKNRKSSSWFPTGSLVSGKVCHYPT